MICLVTVFSDYLLPSKSFKYIFSSKAHERKSLAMTEELHKFEDMFWTYFYINSLFPSLINSLIDKHRCNWSRATLAQTHHSHFQLHQLYSLTRSQCFTSGDNQFSHNAMYMNGCSFTQEALLSNNLELYRVLHCLLAI